MKKIFVIFILFCLGILYPAFAAEKNSVKIEKTNKKYELTEKDSNKQLLPFQYDKIRKIRYDKKTIFVAENKNYISLYSPDGVYGDFSKKYYSTNKINNSIKFENYPSNMVITYKQNKKYGIIAVQNDILHVTKPVFAKIDYPDKKSNASKILNVSFSPFDCIIAYYDYNKSNYGYISLQDFLENKPITNSNIPVILNRAEISEELEINNSTLTFKYNKISFPTVNKIIDNPAFININNLYSLTDLYEYINSYTHLKLIGYPLTGTIQTGHHLSAFSGDIKFNITTPCNDFFDNNLLINELTGIRFDFDNIEHIIAQNGKWGIISKNNEIKTPFIYDLIYPLDNNIDEKAYVNGEKTIIEYQKNTGNDYFLVKKGYGWGVIDSNNNIVIPFEYKKNIDNDGINQIKSQINKKIQQDNSHEDSIKENLPYFIMDLLLLPFWIILPYPFSCYANINYF